MVGLTVISLQKARQRGRRDRKQTPCGRQEAGEVSHDNHIYTASSQISYTVFNSNKVFSSYYPSYLKYHTNNNTMEGNCTDSAEGEPRSEDAILNTFDLYLDSIEGAANVSGETHEDATHIEEELARIRLPASFGIAPPISKYRALTIG